MAQERAKDKPPPAKKIEADIKADRSRFVAFAFCWADVLFELDHERKVVYATGACKQFTGKEIRELIGQPFSDIVTSDDKKLANQLLNIAQKHGRIEDATITLNGDKGAKAPMSFAGYALDDLGGDYFLALRLNKAALTKAKNKNKPDMKREEKSGLYASESFSTMASSRIKEAHATDAEADLTMIQLNGIDELNGRVDNETREQLSSSIGTYLRANSMDGDSAGVIADGKYGLIHTKDLDVASLEKEISNITRDIDPTGKGLDVQAATVEMAADNISEEDLGKGLIYTINQFRISSGGEFNIKDLSTNISALVDQAAQSIKSFQQAITSDKFDVVFHPILDVINGDCHHHEALVRFNGNLKESPFRLITFAEETDLISEFDIAMAKKVVEWLALSPQSKYSVAVNISGKSVDNAKYEKELHALLDANPWLKKRLIFEITESSRVADLHSADRFIQGLRKKGYPVCLDDFGAGAASFQYLSTLEVDVVKLDGSAVQNARTAPKGEAFLTSLCNLCSNMGVKIIAEMVEDQETLNFVRKCGVDYAQGFLFGEPSPDINHFKQNISASMFKKRPLTKIASY